MRQSSDCGIACLATLTGVGWDTARHALGFGPDCGYWGVSMARMRAALRVLGWAAGRERGTDAIVGARGLIFAGAECGFDSPWGAPFHWLAWESDVGAGSNLIQVWEPFRGEMFQFKAGALHNRALRLNRWLAVRPAKRRVGYVCNP